MPDIMYKNKFRLLVNRVNNSIITDSDAIKMIRPGEF